MLIPKLNIQKVGGVDVRIRVPSVSYAIDTLTPAEVATITGQAAPTLMWLGSDASGADELVVGTDDLSDVGSPGKQVNDATLGGLTTEMLDSADSMDAASSSVADIGAETVTIMQIVRHPALGDSVSHTFGKRDGSSPNIGYEAYTDNSSFYQFLCDSASGEVTRIVTVAHSSSDAQVMLFTRQSGTDMQGVWTREGSSTGTRFNETLSSSAIFSVGSARTGGEIGFYGPVMIWIGTDGDFGNAAAFEAARSAIAVALGYE